ncbi:hypothetical protein O6H91_07G060200 [Diphasiastrum complanatum]|uniref:Uncharacterized protein n=1 Tax=Diphasiastrum complanatum TaxID=34168 RepID=A0ACC2D5P8_DIPCM|nr:hypothetical protein O6H91_07G060200 [Diphasiastrum complanatum]
MGFGVSMHAQWQRVVEKIGTSLDRWRNLQANMAGRALVLKHLVIPKVIYFLACWQPSDANLHWFEAMCRNFLWSSDFEKRGFVGVAWSTCLLPKKFGGLSLPDVRFMAARSMAS